jgi:ABC-2 type transport system permease protein
MMKIFWQYIKLTFQVVKLNILSAMEYRVSFLLQVFGMVVNDALLLSMWMVFFARFPNFNGWNFQDTVLLFAISTTNYGLYRIFAGNAEEISHHIVMGELDYFMTLPRSILWQVSTAKSNISAIGDAIFGVSLFFFSGLPWVKFFPFVGLCVLSALVIYNFVVILQSFGFFVGNFEETGDRVFGILLGLCLYPATTFSGVLKFITLVIIPAFFVVWVPLNLLKLFQWQSFLLLIGFWLITLGLAVFIFNQGLKRYESGNLINLRM